MKLVSRFKSFEFLIQRMITKHLMTSVSLISQFQLAFQLLIYSTFRCQGIRCESSNSCWRAWKRSF